MSKVLSPSEYNAALVMYNYGQSWEERANGARTFQAIKKSEYSAAVLPVKECAVEREESLPKLAWLCEIKDQRCSFTIGPGVEHGKDFIAEGVWDGAFSEGGFAESDHFYGSGALLKDYCVFTPPRLCTDYLFVLHDSGRKTSWVSNSFNFIFARAGVSLSSDFYRGFSANINKTTNEHSALGPDLGDSLIAAEGSLIMRRMMHHNFMADGLGNIKLLPLLPQKILINNFADYRRFLFKKAAALLANSRDPARINPYGAISMLSRGYDSTGAAVIAAGLGVKEAVTLDTAVYGYNDNGRKTAAALKMRCHEALSPLGKNISALKTELGAESGAYYEFIAAPGIGDNLVFKGMEPFIMNKLVFSGLYGDSCWSKEGCGSGLAHHLPYMKSRMEFRLRTGYCLAPVPAFGAYFPYFLKKLNNSPEMAPWTLNNNYDRPLPRRLAEEAGVPRRYFGMKKAANNPEIANFSQFFDAAVSQMIRRYEKK